MEFLLRFVLGGLIVSLFAVLGDVLRPKSFAGLFDSAPSVALATLSLAVVGDGPGTGAEEARSMLAGAIALAAYCQLVGCRLMRQRTSSLRAATAAMPLWFAIAFGLWATVLR